MRAGCDALKPEVFRYAAAHLGRDGTYRAVIDDTDLEMQMAAAAQGFVATPQHEEDALYCARKTNYTLPEGFRITSMRETYDLAQYDRVLYKGFNHEQEAPYAGADGKMDMLRAEMDRPNVNLDLKVAAVAPDGNFAAYCGMWYDPSVDFAIVEPVATDPAYRRMGLGRAAVLEGIRRCYALGAKRAFVGSSQQFYYSIGFMPHTTASLWQSRESLAADG